MDPNFSDHTKRENTLALCVTLGVYVALTFAVIKLSPERQEQLPLLTLLCFAIFGWQVLLPCVQLAASAATKIFIPSWEYYFDPTMTTNTIRRLVFYHRISLGCNQTKWSRAFSANLKIWPLQFVFVVGEEKPCDPAEGKDFDILFIFSLRAWSMVYENLFDTDNPKIVHKHILDIFR